MIEDSGANRHRIDPASSDRFFAEPRAGEPAGGNATSAGEPAGAENEPRGAESLRCMEVWGGNLPVERHLRAPGLDVWLYSRPHADEASGGDVYYLSSCASGRISRLLLADVSGHGAEVSRSAVQLRDLMRRHINTISQKSFVEGLNAEFGRVSDEGRFATALVGTFFAGNGGLQICEAGHPPPLVYRQPSRRWEVCSLPGDASRRARPHNTPLGVIEGVEYRQAQFPLRPGDMLLAYTDGLVETAIAKGKLLGVEGLLRLVETLDADQPDRLLSSLRARLRERAAGPADDDQTMLLARANGGAVGWRDNLLAPWRLLFSPRDATRFRGAGEPARDA